MRGSRKDKYVKAPPSERLSYNRLKAQTEEALIWRIRANGLRPMGTFHVADGARLFLGFEWHEAERRRDPDGVCAGGRKVILDALVKGEFIHCDGHHCIRKFIGDDFVFPDSAYNRYGGPGVRLSIEQMYAGGGMAGVTLWLPGRLPDLNELLAAREAGARRMIFRKAAGRG